MPRTIVTDRTADQLRRALTLLEEGRAEKARSIAERVLERQPDHLAAMKVAGHAAWRQGVAQRAFDLLLQVARQEPDDVQTLDALAVAAEEVGQPAIAQEALACAVALDPAGVHRYLRLAQVCFLRGELEQAYGYGMLASRFSPDDPVVHSSVADVLLHLDRASESLEHYEKAIELRPDNAGLFAAAAAALDALGRPSEAIAYRQKAETIAPDDPKIVFQAKGLRRYTSDDPGLLALERALSDGRIATNEETIARLALVKMHDDAGDLEQAAAHLLRANQDHQAILRRRKRHYRAKREEAVVELLLREYRSARERVGTAVAGGSPKNILIAGLPRAGKSLLEYAVARHPGVVALGESEYLHAVRRQLEEGAGTGFPNALRHLSDANRQDLRELLARESLDAAQRAAGVETVSPEAVTSAHPINRYHAALVGLLQSDALLVRVERDPRDLLLSNFMQWFPNGYSFTYTVEGLVHQWIMNQDLMDAWERDLELPVCRVTYEALVADPLQESGRILRELGLKHADEGLELRADATSVTTSPTDKPHPSGGFHEQHTGFWRRWRPHLPELFEAIEAAGLVERYEGAVARDRDGAVSRR